MRDIEAAKADYADLVQARSIARKRAREEFKEALDNRIAELTEWEESILIDRIKSLYDGGMTGAEIQLEVFAGNPQVWADLRDKAGIPHAKRGRPAGEFPHGRAGSYNRGCRCDECREAVREYQREYNRRKRSNPGLDTESSEW